MNKRTKTIWAMVLIIILTVSLTAIILSILAINGLNPTMPQAV